MYVAVSVDYGKSWSKPMLFDTLTLTNCGPSGRGFYGCLNNTKEPLDDTPVIGVDNSSGPHSGGIYLVDYDAASGDARVQVTTFVKATRKFVGPTPVSAGTPGDQFFPWLSVSRTGIVGVTWLDRRNDPGNVNYEEFGAGSRDGGATYPNQKIATKPSNPFNDGYGGMSMGAYTGNAWAGDTLFASWMDTRNGYDAQDFVGALRP
jgi:hypothetical protein